MDQKNPTEVEETGIVIESVEDDMRNLGIEVPESNPDEAEAGETAGSAEEVAAATPGKEDEQPKPKKKSRAQRKIERQAREIKELKEAAGSSQESNPDDTPGKEEKGIINIDDIDIDDYEDYESYQKAVDEAEEVAKTKAAATNTDDHEEKPKGRTKEFNTRIADMREDGNEDYENFEEVVSNPKLALTESVLEKVTESENAADIAYYLGTHLDKAKEIAGMNDKAQAKAIMRIEIELETTPNKVARVTSAPDPINPVGGGNSAATKSLDDDDLSFEEHEALLHKNDTGRVDGFL